MDSLVNYGALPQTYEDPAHKDVLTNLLGDGDPLDVCDISSMKASTGAVYQVKVLGALAMIDGGETDWKLLAVRTDDPLAARVSDVGAGGLPDEVLRAMDAIRHWFRVYKVPEGKGENDFAFEGRWLDLATTLKVVDSAEAQWKGLLKAPPKDGPWVPSAAEQRTLASHEVAPAAELRGITTAA
jgi:inorganic pyrophosphatase